MATLIRDTAAAAIAELRGIVGDLTSPPEFLDEDLLRELDRTARDVRYGELEPAPTIAAGGATTYLIWSWPEGGPWESGAVLQDAGYLAVTPASSDLANGQWILSSTKNPPLYVTGRLFDVHTAAANVLALWANRYARRFDVAADGQSLSRSQAYRALRESEAHERSLGRPVTIPVFRSDEV